MGNYGNLTTAQKNKIRKAFKEQRTKLCWSQRGVANIVGITAATYYNIENGKTWTSEKTLDALFEAFGLDISEFTTEKEPIKCGEEIKDVYQVIIPETDGYSVLNYLASNEIDALKQFNASIRSLMSKSPDIKLGIFKIQKAITNS